MSESSNHNFDHGNHLNFVTTPTTEAPVSGGTPAPETPEAKKKMSLKNKLLITGAGIALAAVAGTGIGIAAAPSGEKAPEATSTSAPANPSHSAEPTPEATPTTTPEATLPDSYDYGITDADVASLKAEDLTTLNNSPLQEKAVLALYYAQTLPKFSKDWEAASQNPLDLVPVEINADNTPDEINSVVANSLRQAMTLTQADGFHFDKDAADKLITANLINGSLSKAYGSLTGFTTQLSTEDRRASNAKAFAASRYFTLPTINTHSEKYTDAAGYTCIDMNTTQVLNGGAAPVTADMTACLVTVNGHSTWMER